MTAPLRFRSSNGHSRLAEWADRGPDERLDPFEVRDYLLELPLRVFFYVVEIDDQSRGLWEVARPWERVVLVEEDGQLYRVDFFSNFAARVVEVDDVLEHLHEAGKILAERAYAIDRSHVEVEMARLSQFIWRFQTERDNGGLQL